MASMGDAQRVGQGGLSKLTDGPRTTSDLSKVGGGLTRGPNQGKKLNAAAWSETWPAQGSTLDLDFANDRGWVRGVGQGRSMDAVTFTRASVGKFVDADGIVQDAANGQPRFDWASTTSTGAGTIADPRIIPLAANPTSNGLLIEESRANRILWCRDATQANWVSTNVTAAKDQTGIDGVANAASSLTATANDGTCIQTITLASGSRTGSVYLKRITGTGNVQVSLDGSTYSTVDLSASEWRRIVLSGTVTNPTVGIKLAVSGDAVAMDYGQVEDGAFVTSPILTTTASVTRAGESATIQDNNFRTWYNYQGGTICAEFLLPPFSATGSVIFALSAQDNANYFILWRLSATQFRHDNTGLSGGASAATIPMNDGQKYKTATSIRQYLQESTVSNYANLITTGRVPVNYIWFRIGESYNSSSKINNCIARIFYIPAANTLSSLYATSGSQV
jgi:hypothetical protein